VNDATGGEFTGGAAKLAPLLLPLPPPPHEVMATDATATSVENAVICTNLISPSSQPSSAAGDSSS
jgi:hypothetical protein